MNDEHDNQFRLSRLNMFLFDFQDALRFAHYILKRKWPKRMNPESGSGLVHLAFNTSLIISYSRPFHKNREGVGLRSARLNPDVVGLNDAERALHKSVLDKRDQVYAPSDATAREVDGWDYNRSGVQLYKVVNPLTKVETRMLGAMIGKWITHLQELRSEKKLGTEPGAVATGSKAQLECRSRSLPLAVL
jgi:hypothetical protein